MKYKCKIDNHELTIFVVNSGIGYCSVLHGYKDCKTYINLKKIRN